MTIREEIIDKFIEQNFDKEIKIKISFKNIHIDALLYLKQLKELKETHNIDALQEITNQLLFEIAQKVADEKEIL